MIGFLVWGRVRIKIRIRVRVRVTFNVRVYRWSNCRRSKCRTILARHVMYSSVLCIPLNMNNKLSLCSQ